MHKAAIAFTIALCALLAHAQESESVFLGASPDVSVYVYPSTVNITKSGLVQAWSLYDMSSRQFINNVYLQSVKSLNVIDCHDRRIGILNDIYYSQRGGKGKVVWNGKIEMSALKWEYIAPNSMSELKFDFICDIAKAKQSKR
jgi:hypothetical protein